MKTYAALPDSDAPCDACGYVLRGQPLDGRCPECGQSVATTTARAADRLAGQLAVTGAGDERRMSDLRWGPWLILAAFTCSLLIPILGDVAQTFLARGIAWLAGWVLAATGVFISTRAARHESEPMNVALLRLIVRGLLLVAVTLPLFVLGPKDLSWNSPIVTLIVPAMAWCAFMVGPAFFAYAARVAWLGRRRLLAVQCLMIFVASVIVWGAIAEKSGSRFMRMRGAQLVRGLDEMPMPGVVFPASALQTINYRYGGWEGAISLLVNAAGWWPVPVLLQLGLMSSRPVAEGSGGRSGPSSRP